MSVSQHLDVLARAWVQDRVDRGRIGRTSAPTYRSALARLVDTAVEHGDLDEAALRDWERRIGQLAPATRSLYVGAVTGFCRWLAEEGHLQHDPSGELIQPRIPKGAPRALSAEHVASSLAACRDERAVAIAWMMVGCGLRCIDTSNLDLDDLDLVAMRLFVRGKGGHERVLPVPPFVRPALERWLTVRGLKPGPLFVTRRGSRLLALLQQLMGHSSLATTEKYLGVADLGRLRVAVEGRNYLVVPGGAPSAGVTSPDAGSPTGGPLESIGG